jgi:hypothetical protein
MRRPRILTCRAHRGEHRAFTVARHPGGSGAWLAAASPTNPQQRAGHSQTLRPADLLYGQRAYGMCVAAAVSQGSDIAVLGQQLRTGLLRRGHGSYQRLTGTTDTCLTGTSRVHRLPPSPWKRAKLPKSRAKWLVDAESAPCRPPWAGHASGGDGAMATRGDHRISTARGPEVVVVRGQVRRGAASPPRRARAAVARGHPSAIPRSQGRRRGAAGPTLVIFPLLSERRAGDQA